jgi:hypothetical protein
MPKVWNLNMALNTYSLSFNKPSSKQPPYLRHGFWLQSCADVYASEVGLLDNGEVHKEFDEDNHYVGHASNCLLPSFCVAMDCHEGYMLILHHGDDCTCWDTNHNFCWRVDFKHGPSWITYSILIAWKPWKNHSGLLYIPHKHIAIAKGNSQVN